MGSRALGTNPQGFYVGAQDATQSFAHFDLLMKGGGVDSIPGDYLFRDRASFGNTGGMWGILRVQ